MAKGRTAAERRAARAKLASKIRPDGKTKGNPGRIRGAKPNKPGAIRVHVGRGWYHWEATGQRLNVKHGITLEGEEPDDLTRQLDEIVRKGKRAVLFA